MSPHIHTIDVEPDWFLLYIDGELEEEGPYYNKEDKLKALLKNDTSYSMSDEWFNPDQTHLKRLSKCTMMWRESDKMSDPVTCTELAEWIEGEYPDNTIIRIWSNGDVGVSMDEKDMEEDTKYTLSKEDLPGDWAIQDTIWSKRGISFELTRSINL